MFNPAKAAEEIKKEYIGYISTTYRFKNAKLQDKLVKELNKTISNGPFVEVNDSFKSGGSLTDLINRGILSTLFENLEKGKDKPKLPLDRPLYLHQQNAVEKIVKGRNVIISTGTGSGKTNCFIIPVVNELLREEEQGSLCDGVRAIFIYPMNALANDQIKSLREILMDYPKIRFGVYNGGTENHEKSAIELYKLMYAKEKNPKLREPLPNEVLSRDEMKKRPPHILFTNYAMLEHLLLRPGDDVIFTNSKFKYVVLDEAHVYAGATGIETSFLLSRLKGRLNSSPQFILTSATLGDGSEDSNKTVVEFARRLTGCDYETSDIVTAYREPIRKSDTTFEYPKSLFVDLANEELSFSDVLSKYGFEHRYSVGKEPEILYDILTTSSLYYRMRNLGNLIELKKFIEKLDLTEEEAVCFVTLCAKARKNGKPLVDIRYHYFLRALDGCFVALDYPDSLSLVRKNSYELEDGISANMFEIAVCDDCGEMALVGEISNGYLKRSTSMEKSSYFQINTTEEAYEEGEESTSYFLCKNCGAIVHEDEACNQWCSCGNTQKIRIKELSKDKCSVCHGNLRRFNLGYDAATGVIATSLYEQIPEYTYIQEENDKSASQNNLFLKALESKKKKVSTGSQFLVFSDSRQGAAKFACFMEEMYKQFLRRRGIWNVIRENEDDERFANGVGVSDLVKLLNNYFSNHNLFRKSNADSDSSIVENNRNAWVAVVDELYNCNRDTSLASLGMLSFDYKGITDDIINAVAKTYNMSESDSRNFLNYLVFEIVRTGAIVTDKNTDINDSDREYLFFSPQQRFVTKEKDSESFNSYAFLPTRRLLKDGTKTFYRSNKLIMTKNALRVDDEDAVKFLKQFWEYLIDESNDFSLESRDGRRYCVPARNIKVRIGKNAKVWICKKCGKKTQFNIGGHCVVDGCGGDLESLSASQYCQENYYARLYDRGKITPLFIKEHTAQLAKQDALDYQQQFVRKEINALSCSTTFEMGVDVGDLETVFLRNIPPLASNYAQRVGRAGRSIDAAAFAMTFARQSSHDFTFFSKPEEMIKGRITPPLFSLNNEKILKRHVYAVAIGLFLKLNPDMYSGNQADKFIDEKGYVRFIDWLRNQPVELTNLLKNSNFHVDNTLKEKYVDSFEWLDEFCGEDGTFTKIKDEYERNVNYLQTELKKAKKNDEIEMAAVLERKIKRYKKNELIDFLVRGNILPKYGFPIDSVELSQNFASDSFKSLNLTRDLSVAIAEYAPSAEVVADGKLYTSRYIRKPMVNKGESNVFDTAYLAECSKCKQINYSSVPVGKEGKVCIACGNLLKKVEFHESIEPRSGFVAEADTKDVPLTSQERKYKTEAVYIGDKEARVMNSFDFEFGSIPIRIESTTNDSLVVKSTDDFYVCSKCGYSVASDEKSILKKYEDFRSLVMRVEKTTYKHDNPFGKGKCDNVMLKKYGLHHEFKTDVAKIIFGCDTSDYFQMMSVMYALLNSFAAELSIERRDIKGCLSSKWVGNHVENTIIIYDDVPGGAGHSRRLVTEDGSVLKKVIRRAISVLDTCTCEPSCYRCLRSYENQKYHENLDRNRALDFLKRLEE